MISEWTKVLVAALGGGVTVKILDIAYLEIRRRLDTGQTSKKFVDEHLDPLLKSADEVVGKLCSLALEDFKTMHVVQITADGVRNNDFASLLYLISKLWAHIELIRRESLSVSLVKDLRGKRLQQFLDCLESRHVRLVDRITQRAIGELMLGEKSGKQQSLSFIDFMRKFETEADTRRWVKPLETE